MLVNLCSCDCILLPPLWDGHLHPQLVMSCPLALGCPLWASVSHQESEKKKWKEFSSRCTLLQVGLIAHLPTALLQSQTLTIADREQVHCEVMLWQNICPALSLLRDLSNVTPLLCSFCASHRKSWQTWITATGLCSQEQEVLPTAMFPAPLSKTSISKPTGVSACLVCQIWMLLLFHNRQAVLTKAQPTAAIINCQQHSLEAASSSSCCLQTRCQYFLAGSAAKSHKSFLYFQIYRYGDVWPFQDKSIMCVS